jgi:DNA-binding NarL/FixJ family response regulator
MARTVVIVDDHADFRQLAGRLLEACGFEVIGEAGDGTEALELARRLCPDLMLVDVQLPDLDGFEVATALYADRIPVVLVSSREAEDYELDLMTTTARGFISKRDLSGASLASVVDL